MTLQIIAYFYILYSRLNRITYSKVLPVESLHYIKIIVLKFVCLSRFECLSATDEKHFCAFSCMRFFHTNHTHATPKPFMCI